MDVIKLPPERFSVVIIDPTISYAEEKKFHCTFCGKWLFSMNRKFAFTHHGGPMVAGVNEVPNNVFRMTRLCGTQWCRHYYVIYFDGGGE